MAGVVSDFEVFGRGVLVGTHDTEGELWYPYLADAADAEVEAVMQRPELVVSPEADLEATLLKLAKAGQDCCIAVDRRGVAVGILTEHDPVRYASALIEEERGAIHDASFPVQTTRLDERLEDVHREMLERWVRHLVVLDEDGKVHSVISYRDVIAAEAHLGADANVADAVPRFGAKCLPRTASTADCARLMAEHHIGCVPIVDDEGRPVAIITRTNIIEATAFALEEEALFEYG